MARKKETAKKAAAKTSAKVEEPVITEQYTIQTSTDDVPVFRVIDNETGESVVTDPFITLDEAIAYRDLLLTDAAQPAIADAPVEVVPKTNKKPEKAQVPEKKAVAADTAVSVVEEVPVWRYTRRAGYPKVTIDKVDYFPGQEYAADRPNTIPAAFMDGWELVSDPSIDGKKPRLVKTVAGFDLVTVAGRKLNDLPITATEAEELLGGIAS